MNLLETAWESTPLSSEINCCTKQNTLRRINEFAHLNLLFVQYYFSHIVAYSSVAAAHPVYIFGVLTNGDPGGGGFQVISLQSDIHALMQLYFMS